MYVQTNYNEVVVLQQGGNVLIKSNRFKKICAKSKLTH